MKPIGQFMLAALVFSMVMAGCSSANSVKSAVVNGNPVTATEDATFRTQYAAMCKQQAHMQPADDEVDMDKLCECVGEKMTDYRRTERVEGEDAASKHMPEAMMSCMPGGNEMMKQAHEQMGKMDELQRQADEQQRLLEEQTGSGDGNN